MLKILSNLINLSRKGLPLRGDGDESNSNFSQLLKLRAEDDPRVSAWMEKKTDKYVIRRPEEVAQSDGIVHST